MALAAVSLWWTLRTQEERQLEQQVLIEALRARSDQRMDVESAIQSINRLVRLWQRRHTFGEEELSFEAALDVTEHAHLEAIEWVDPTGRVLWAVPAEVGAKLRNRDLSIEARRKMAFDAARLQDQVVLTRPVELVMGGKGFLLIRPVHAGKGLVGFLVGVVRFRELVGATLDEEFPRHYSLSIVERGETVYSATPVDPAIDSRWGVEVELGIANQTWRLRVCPTARTIDRARGRLPEVTLGAGLLLATLLGWALHLARVARQRADLSESLNLHLSDQIFHRRRAESERDRFFNLSSDMLCVVGLDGTFRQVNPAWERTLGIPLAELMVRPVSALAHPEDGDPIGQAQTAGCGSEPVSFEGRFRTGGGEFKWLHWSMSVSHEETACYAVARDVSERKHWEEVVARHVEELTRSNAELEQFAYVASHDLQEPLRMVAIYTDLLAKQYSGRLDGQADKFIGYVVEGATRMQSLINDLLNFARVEGRGTPETVCLDAALDTALQNLRVTIEQTGARVEHDPLPSVRGHATYLVQLFQNLLGNAIKFRSENPPHITIGATREGEVWTIAVRDNGIGIDPRHLGRVFQIFERLHPRSRYPGNGIGLAVCRKIVQLHRGRIWVESVPGQGSTFYFSLPGEGSRSA